jgi:hypothetical protein
LIKGKLAPEKCKIVAATSIREETSLEKCENALRNNNNRKKKT